MFGGTFLSGDTLGRTVQWPPGRGHITTFPIVFGYISYQIRILMYPACILKDTRILMYPKRILHALLHSKR